MEKALGIGVHAPELMADFALLVSHVITAAAGSPYERELHSKFQAIERVLKQELEQFQETLQAGSNRLDTLIAKAKQTKRKVLSGEEAFELYDTYGFPYELTSDIASEKGLTVDRVGFDRALEAQQQRSRAASQFTGGVFVSDDLQVREAVKGLPSKDAQFVGYESLQAEAVIKGLWDGKAWVNKVTAGQQAGIVLDRSPFYGESGGQVGDTGTIEGPRGAADVGQTSWIDDVLVHHASVRQGTLSVQEPARARVSAERRLKVARSHTAAHMLHWALRTVLGPETVQAGSLVEEERVRFDFSSLKGLQEEQRHDVQVLVNRRVALADEVRAAQMRLEEAKRAGALALFGEKYGSSVRVVTIGDYSKELCGGTHLLHTGYVGTFMITGESSIAAGTRRIEALVGEAAAERQRQEQRLLHEVAKRLGRSADDVVAGLEELLEQLKQAERERKTLQREAAKVQAQRLVAEAKKINGITFVSSTIKHADRELLAALADAVRSSLQKDGVVLLASSEGPEHVSLVMAATTDLTTRIHAGNVLKAVSPLTKGSGGGRPEFAQAGGKDPSGIPAALKRAEQLVSEALEHA
jgi:alanyl-tRNA synthetase